MFRFCLLDSRAVVVSVGTLVLCGLYYSACSFCGVGLVGVEVGLTG